MKTKKQYAALPYIVFKNHIEVLLITRRRSQRWIVPKGWPEDDLSPHKLAELEAYEEAGLRGQIGKKSIGRFSYIKQLSKDEKILCDVEVYPLAVRAQCLDWPEKGQRLLLWLKPKKAAALIDEQDLGEVIRHFIPPKNLMKTGTTKMPKSNTKPTIKTKAKSALNSKINASF
jgi:8-oxo-dGTP pyrophosphatase MutT (NUDIX family)